MIQDNMINEILNFVGRNQESTASIAVLRRILGTYPGGVTGETLAALQDKLQSADPEDIESCYFIIK